MKKISCIAIVFLVALLACKTNKPKEAVPSPEAVAMQFQKAVWEGNKGEAAKLMEGSADWLEIVMLLSEKGNAEKVFCTDKADGRKECKVCCDEAGKEKKVLLKKMLGGTYKVQMTKEEYYDIDLNSAFGTDMIQSQDSAFQQISKLLQGMDIKGIDMGGINVDESKPEEVAKQFATALFGANEPMHPENYSTPKTKEWLDWVLFSDSKQNRRSYRSIVSSSWSYETVNAKVKLFQQAKCDEQTDIRIKCTVCCNDNMDKLDIFLLKENGAYIVDMEFAELIEQFSKPKLKELKSKYQNINGATTQEIENAKQAIKVIDEQLYKK